MGTTSGDAAYALVSAPPKRDLDPLHAAAFARRWKEWEPLLLIEARSQPRIIPEAMARFRETHTDYLTRCFQAGMNWTTIRRNRQDDPRRSAREFGTQLEYAKERRQRNIDREARKKERHHA